MWLSGYVHLFTLSDHQLLVFRWYPETPLFLSLHQSHMFRPKGKEILLSNERNRFQTLAIMIRRYQPSLQDSNWILELDYLSIKQVISNIYARLA